MSDSGKIKLLLEKYGQPFSEEIGFHISNTPVPLFKMLCTANLFSARINYNISVDAAKALFDHGWTSAEKMKSSSWAERVKALNEANYTRHQERTSSFLGDLADKVHLEYHGDLRNLREQAERKSSAIRQLLKNFKGMGNVAVDIFMREAQMVWPELYPFADQKARQAAKKLGLKSTPESLREYVPERHFNELLSALIRMDLNSDYDLNKNGSSEGSEEDYQKLVVQSKEELYKKAKQHKLPNRSKMNKDQLAKNLAK